MIEGQLGCAIRRCIGAAERSSRRVICEAEHARAPRDCAARLRSLPLSSDSSPTAGFSRQAMPTDRRQTSLNASIIQGKSKQSYIDDMFSSEAISPDGMDSILKDKKNDTASACYLDGEGTSEKLDKHSYICCEALTKKTV